MIDERISSKLTDRIYRDRRLPGREGGIMVRQGNLSMKLLRKKRLLEGKKRS